MLGVTFVHMLRCVSGIGDPRSQTSESEREALRRHSDGKLRGVEIGVHEGVTTCLIAEKLAHGGVLYSIDPFLKGRLGICWSKLIATTAIRRAGLEDRVRLIETFSHDAAGYLLGQFDLVFVDGDHSLAGISRDWSDWAGRVEPGGVIALHDTRITDSNPMSTELGTVKFFDSRIKHDDRFEVVEQVDSLSILRRTN